MIFFLLIMKDNFSKQANIYAQFRPDYPDELFDFILNHVKNTHLAWDCATGNGQAAKVLAQNFVKVIGTDISEKQLVNAYQVLNVEYLKCPAEETPFEANSFDLITVAQALHWFDFERFFREVKRILKKDGVFVTWGYELNTVEAQIDAKCDTFTNLFWVIIGIQNADTLKMSTAEFLFRLMRLLQNDLSTKLLGLLSII
jgi:ubiquinone/menaquinone biosynthesis C-methylase UbiE